MIVMKFGGTSLGTPERIENVCEIVTRAHGERGVHAVICSAFSGITNTLIEMADRASRRDETYRDLLDALNERHLKVAAALIPAPESMPLIACIEQLVEDLRDVAHGVFLIRELSPRTLDFISGFGERLSARIVAEALARHIPGSAFLDTRQIIRTDDQFGMARVDQEATRSLIRAHFEKNPDVQVVTGFIASTETGQATTLGRGGSDYTASLIGAAIQCSQIEIWTDVDGVLTADPRKVDGVFVQPAITYEEAMEMAHFGAKVIFPPTMAPAIQAEIPMIIKNSLDPDAPGTRIGKAAPDDNKPVRGISSIPRIALLLFKGSGLIGVEGISNRLFGTLAGENINVILISQASSEYSICVGIPPDDAEKAKSAIDKTFHHEIATGQINEVSVETGLSVIAVVGEGMRRHPGIAGKIFSALGRHRINVIAVAQGSSERNVSFVVGEDDEHRALSVVHQTFFHDGARRHIFLIGTGLIGTELMRLIDQREHDKRDRRTIRVVAAGNRKRMIFDKNGIANFQDLPENEVVNWDPDLFMERLHSSELTNKILVDCTAASDIGELYAPALRAGISVVTPNKKANTGTYSDYLGLRDAAKTGGSHYLYEANVGAGLPVISTVKTLVQSGDRILKIEAILSGTLAFLFNTFSRETPFSMAVKTARDLGFTEPDPRDDLNGTDVARKLLILARESGVGLELEDIQVETLVPEECRGTESVTEFMEALSLADAFYMDKLEKALRAGKVLRYLACFEAGKAMVRLAEVGPDHPCYHLAGNDNLISLTTERYRTNPLIIQGPGAGARVTAAQVLAEIVQIGQNP